MAGENALQSPEPSGAQFVKTLWPDIRLLGSNWVRLNISLYTTASVRPPLTPAYAIICTSAEETLPGSPTGLLGEGPIGEEVLELQDAFYSEREDDSSYGYPTDDYEEPELDRIEQAKADRPGAITVNMQVGPSYQRGIETAKRALAGFVLSAELATSESQPPEVRFVEQLGPFGFLYADNSEPPQYAVVTTLTEYDFNPDRDGFEISAEGPMTQQLLEIERPRYADDYDVGPTTDDAMILRSNHPGYTAVSRVHVSEGYPGGFERASLELARCIFNSSR